MVSPLREKRAWPPREKDAESAESAAFEAAVAVVKETVVRSGEVLVSAKEDLSDHKRWLEVQRAASQADRARHERWLQRQQEEQEALARRERAKRRRQLMRQRAMQAVENAAFAALDFVLSLFWGCVAKIAAFFAYLRASILSGFAWAGARLSDLAAYLTRLAKSAASAIAGKTRALAGSTGSALSAAGSSLAAKSGSLARSTGSAFAAASSSLAAKSVDIARSTGNALSAAGSSLAAKSGSLARSTGSMFAAASSSLADIARSTGNALSAAGSSVAAKSAELAQATGDRLAAASSPAPAEPADGSDQASVATREQTPLATPDALTEAAPGNFAEEPAPAPVAEAALARSTGEGIASRLALVLARAAMIVRSIFETLARLIATMSAKAAPLAQAIVEQTAFSAISTKIHVLAPLLHGGIAKAADMAGVYARKAAARGGAMFARIKPSASAHENEVSSSVDALSSPEPARLGGFNLSQMLIISGVVLLVCGGLLVGSGLMLRSGTVVGTAVEKPPSPHAVAWFFEEPELPIVERSVFTAELTPHGVRLTGFAIKAENNSDDALSGVEGVVKPDVKRLDLKLEVKVDIVPTEGAHGAAAAEVQGNGVIPPHAFFSLVLPFRPEAHGEAPGIALNDFIAAYGGLMLKLRYAVAGTQKSLIHYLSPEMLKAQLTEIQHEADGS